MGVGGLLRLVRSPPGPLRRRQRWSQPGVRLPHARLHTPWLRARADIPRSVGERGLGPPSLRPERPLPSLGPAITFSSSTHRSSWLEEAEVNWRVRVSSCRLTPCPQAPLTVPKGTNDKRRLLKEGLLILSRPSGNIGRTKRISRKFARRSYQRSNPCAIERHCLPMRALPNVTSW